MWAAMVYKMDYETQQHMVIIAHQATFVKLIRLVKISDPRKPMTLDQDDELGLWNPYSVISVFILYIYSIEFGDPPLYSELNKASREMNKSQLKNLGAFAYALWQITY
jgi:hypothetical protein